MGGAKFALACAPATVVVSTLCLALGPSPIGILVTETLRKVTSYGLAKPTRELLFAHVSADAKYKSKLVLDVVVQRMGDTLGAATFAALNSGSVSPSGLALTCALTSTAWYGVAYTLGQQHDRIVLEKNEYERKAHTLA
jgi:ATP:ADP antiporter, AAA family